MTKTTILTACVIVLTLIIAVVAVLNFPTTEAWHTSQAVAEKEAEMRLIEAKERYNQSIVEGRKALQRLETLEYLEGGLVYQTSLEIALAIKNLWIVFAFGAVIFIAYSQRSRLVQQVEFVAGDIKTTIPANDAVRLTERVIQSRELADSGHILALQDDRTQERLKETVNAMKALRGILPNDTQSIQPALDVTQSPIEALPAFSGPVHLSQLILDNDYEPGLIPYGRDLETGNIVQVDFPTRKTCLKLGEQGTGKSTGTKAELFAALTLKYEIKTGDDEPKYRIFIIDAHYGFDQSLATDLKPYLSLFDGTILGKDCLGPKLVDFLQGMIAEAEAFQESDIDIPDTIDVIIFDEYNETIEYGEDGKAVEKAVKRLVNLRKAGKYLSINVYDGSKGEKNNKGLSPVKMACSSMIYRTNETQAGNVLGWRHKDIINQIPEFTGGRAVLHIPDAKSEDGTSSPIMSVVQTCMVEKTDFLKFAKYVTEDTTTQNAAQTTDTESFVNPDAILTPQQVKNHHLSQRKLAKASGVSQTKISDFVNGNDRLSEEEKAMIYDVIYTENGPTWKKVVNLNNWAKLRRIK